MERAPGTRRTTYGRRHRLGKRGHGGRHRRGFSGEPLESRIALSADSINPSIFGTVFSDFDGDGVPGANEVLAEVGLQLFRDDGDRHFSPNTDMFVSSTTTDNAGVYRFEDLDPDGAYFVVRFAQTIGDKPLGEVISPVIEPGRPGAIIDLFQTRQILAVNPPAVASDGNTRAFPAENEVIGGERDLYAELISGVGDVTLSVNPFGIEELLEFNNAPATIGNRMVTWDGPDNDSDKLSLGLGGRDLTQDGAHQGIVLRGGVDESGAMTTLELRIYQGSPDNFSRIPFRLPVTGGDASGYIFLPFEDFEGSVSPTNVDAVQLLIEGGAQGTDGKLALIGALGPARFDIGEVDQADLTIQKSNSVDALLPGDATSYVITVTNQGPAWVQGANVVDIFSDELSEVSYISQASGQVSGNTESGTGNIQDVVDMAPGSSITYVVQAKVSETAVGPIVNVAEVSTPPEILDPDVTNNTSTDRDPIGAETDLQITKDDARREVRVGDTVTYRIDARNNGSVDIRGARVTDEFPAELDNVTFVSQGSSGTSGNTASGSGDIDDLVDIPAGGVIRYTVTATVSDRAVGTLVNRAFIEQPSGFVDVNPTDNVEIDVNLIQRELVDISVTKSNGTDQVVPGQSVTYSIIVRNDGPSNAARVNVVDDFPDQLLNVTYTSQSVGGASNASEQGTGNIDDVVDLPAGSSIIYLATGTVAPDAVGAIENTASTTVPDNDVNPGNNRATDVDLLVGEIDLAITKSDQNTVVRPGDVVTYEVVVTNHGPSDVVGARVMDVVPSTLVDVTYTRSLGGDVSAGQGDINDTIDLVAGESARYVIMATVATTADGNIDNTATVTAPAGVIEVELGNNSATDTNQVARGFVDVSVRKFSDPPIAVPGRDLHYTIVVANIGQSAVEAARLQDALPTSLENVRYTSEASGDVSGYTSGTGSIDDVLQMAPGAAVVYSVTGTVAADVTGTIRNTVSVDTSGQVDSNPSNNLDVDVVGVRAEADLVISKSDGRSQIDVGDPLVYEIVVRNNGPSDVANVSVTDELPAGYEGAKFTATSTGGATGYTPTGTGGLDETVDLPVGSTITYRMEGVVTQAVAGMLTNTARVRGPLEDGFIELDPSNNLATDVDIVSSMVVLGSEPTVIRARETIEVGDTNRYQMTAHETGRMIVTTHFSHALGDLQLAVFDNRGNLIAFVDSETDNEQLVIPVVSQETYVVVVSAATENAANLYDLEIENFETPVPDVLRLTAATDSGMMSDDGVTNAIAPNVIIQADVMEFVRAEIPVLVPPDADTDLPLEAGVAVGVIVTNVETGESTQGFATPVGESATLFSYAPAGLPDGEYTVSAFVQVQDGAQRQELPVPAVGRSTLSEPYWLTIDRTAPQAADRPVLLDSSDSGMSFDDQVTNVDQPALAGIGEPNVKVRVTTNRINGELEVVGQSVTNADGSWEITVEPLDDDWYHFRPEFEDLAGNVSSIAEPLVVEVDTLAPNTPFLDLVRTSDTGISDADNITSNSELTFSMTTDDLGLHLIPFNYKFRLFLRPDAEDGSGAGQEVLIYDSSLDPDVPVENLLDGLTDLSHLTRTLGPFPDGVHNFKLEVEDRAGNISHDFLLNVTIDTVPPSPTFELSPVSESGTYTDDGVINKMSPVFDGVTEVGTRVELFANGRLVGTGVAGSDDSDGQPGDGLGAWEITSEPLVDGNYEFSTRFEDLAGNEATGESIEVWIDTAAPNIPQLQPLMDVTLDGWITNDATPDISITTSDTVDGGLNPFPHDLRYRVFDRPGDEQGEVLIVDSFGALRELTTGGFFLETLPELSDGFHNLKVEVEDRAGNVSHAFLRDVLVDTQSPESADFQLLTSSDTGMSRDDRVTNIQQPAFSGTSTVGDAVRILANGSLVGVATVQSDASDGVDDDGQGLWEITVEPLADDTYEVVVEVEDAAGNVTRSDPQTIWIDTRSPNQPFLNLISDSGVSGDDNVTNVNAPVVQIVLNDTVEGGENPFPHDIKYRIYDRTNGADGEILLVDSFAAAGDFVVDGQVELTLPELADGLHNLKLEVEDRAGNLSHAFLLDVTIDTVPPDASPVMLASSDTGMFDDDFVTSIRQPTLKGINVVGHQVSVFADGQLVGTAVVGSDPTDGIDGDGLGAWEVVTAPLADGTYDMVTHVEDLAGNFAQSDAVALTVDTLQPNIPHLDILSDSGHDGDNVTNVANLEVAITINDTPDGGDNPFPHDLKVRVYERIGGGDGEQLIYDSFVDLEGFTELGQIVTVLPELSDGVHNLKVEAEDRAGNISMAFLVDVEIDTQGPDLGDPEIDLAEYADSGMSSSDRVTNIQRPAILGRATPGSRVIVYANGEIAGTGIVNGDDSDGEPDDGFGAWEITVEPLDDDVYEMVAMVHDEAGNSVTTEPLTIEIDTLAPNLPFLDLAEDFDTGRHNDDNLTRSEQLLFQATSSDPNADNHLVLIPDGQNFKYRIFDRPEGGEETLVYDSSIDASLPDLLDGLTAATQILTNSLDLAEVSHNLKLEVEDRAGNISHDFLLELLVDRTPFVGAARLHPDSDSGNINDPGSFRDGITNDRSPKFTGFAEANSLVSITIDGVPAGTAVAIPLDGDDAVQPPNSPYNLDGTWTIDSVLVLEDGEHDVVVTYEDPAGNQATSGLENDLVISTGGIQIINVTRVEPGFPSLFDPKPTSGPDPLIPQIAIHLQSTTGTDLLLGDPTNLTEEGHYLIVGDSNGHIPVARVEVEATDDGQATVILTFTEPLPDDRFTITVSEKLSDRAGNRLDGESGAIAPFEGAPGRSPLPPIFPTGDGEPGGDFHARFTVDSRPEIGTWGAGSVWADINGNFEFDPENRVDFVNRDIVYRYGFTSDDIFAGNFALPGEVTDGYDKLGAYGIAEGEFRWLVDTDNDGVPNIDRIEPSAANGRPVAGRFDSNSQNGDEVGVFDGTYWYFDTNHDFMTDTRLRSHLVGYPIVADFDGDGFDDLATWADNRFMIDLAEGRLRGWDGFAEEVIGFGFIGVRERPVAADMDQDGFADLGLWVPDREGQVARASSEWYFLMSDGESLFERLSPADDPIDTFPVIDFRPIPFGPDVFAQFGDDFAEPIVGNFDPPTLLLEVETPLDSWTNPDDVLDVSGDRQISPFDALLIINELNTEGPHELGTRLSDDPFFDVNEDGFISPLDALLVLNELNRNNRVRLASEEAAPAVAASNASVASALVADDRSKRTRLTGDHRQLDLAEDLHDQGGDLGRPVDLGLMSPLVRAHDWDEVVHLIATEQVANRSRNDNVELESDHTLGRDRGV